jgi:hypothetical protein
LRDIHGREREPGKAIAQGGCDLERPHTLKKLQQSRISGKADERKPECTFFAGSTIDRYSSFSGIAVAVGCKIAAGKLLIYGHCAPLWSPNSERWQSRIDRAGLEIKRIKQLKLLQTNNLARITARTEADQNIGKCCLFALVMDFHTAQ